MWGEEWVSGQRISSVTGKAERTPGGGELQATQGDTQSSPAQCTVSSASAHGGAWGGGEAGEVESRTVRA